VIAYSREIEGGGMMKNHELPRITCIACTAVAARGAVIFQDNFTTPGTQLNLAEWTTEN
jgi:hypothetical protein